MLDLYLTSFLIFNYPPPSSPSLIHIRLRGPFQFSFMIQLSPQFVSGFADGAKALVVFGTNLTSTVGIKFTLKQL